MTRVSSGALTLDTTGSNHALTMGDITIGAGSTFLANGSTVTMTSTGDTFIVTGTFTPGTSTVVYTGTSATNITATTYNNLSLTPAGAVTYTLGTASSQTTNVGGNFVMGNGTNALTVDRGDSRLGMR